MMSDEYTIAKYLRLSLEDGDLDEAKDESNSISNQRKLLDYYIEQHPDLSGAKILEFVDDGYSGTSFDRPGVQKLLQMVKENKINCIMIKDFSRWGRDYIMVSDYLEQIFPFLQVRVISVNDNYDSATIASTAGNIEVGFTNIMHDMYSKELSRKLLLTKRQLFEAGKYHSSYPFYGYLKSTNEKYHLEIEPGAAGVIKKIFRWYAAGSSTKEIAQKLNRTNTMTPLLWLVKFCGFKPRFEKGSTTGELMIYGAYITGDIQILAEFIKEPSEEPGDTEQPGDTETPDDTEKPGESENPDGETPSEVPETGDAANITVWLLVFAASAILVILTFFKRKGTAK